MNTKKTLLIFCSIALGVILFSFQQNNNTGNYSLLYLSRLDDLNQKQQQLLQLLKKTDLSDSGKVEIRKELNIVRKSLKNFDFWARYLDPISYKLINGPLPVEWETEVFEKFEKPYKRYGAGFTLANNYLDEENVTTDSLISLIQLAQNNTQNYRSDSITQQLNDYHHFFLCNRLFLLNLAAIYTTGFECPDPARIIPELRTMLAGTQEIYYSFNNSFPEKSLDPAYLELYHTAILFVNRQPDNFDQFDHFSFLRDYVNPLFALNQGFIRNYQVNSKSYVDYTLNKSVNSIFSKNLYSSQNTKGVYLRIYDTEVLSQIESTGRSLFYDPILSGNNQRSCASCHKPDNYFTDTSVVTSLHFDGHQSLQRNSPSLINANFNHLIMYDGIHISLQDQALAVITNSAEMSCDKNDVLKKVMSCPDYKKAFTSFLKYTPQYHSVEIEHISSALSLYYSKFSKFYSPFDEAMNKKRELTLDERKGFNVFMSKAQCGTCHFVPQFNGVKPPYVGSEFEVLGVPSDKNFSALSPDKGRYNVNPAIETISAFRTGSLRNIERTKPYMHNGVFSTLEEVIDFYDAGGGAGRGLSVSNQTLSSDSLHLSADEKKYLIAFMKSLNEEIPFDPIPAQLPKSKLKTLNFRKVNGSY